MKSRLLGLCIVAIAVSSCVSVSTGTPFSAVAPTGSSVLATFTPQITQSPAEENDAFIEPDPDTYVMVLPAVLKYFYYRKKAMIAGTVDELWNQYPELRNGVDIATGINAEEFFISNYRGLELFDGNIFPEEYERFKVKQEAEEIEVLVHGVALYLFLDENEQFQESGGEFKIVLSLRRKNGHWDVVKTDEVMQHEWHLFSP